MKTKEVIRQVSGFSGARCKGKGSKSVFQNRKSKAPKSLGAILSPDSCLRFIRNEGDSGDIYENKGRDKAGVGFQVPDARCQGKGSKSVFQNRKPKAPKSLGAILSPDSGLPSSALTKMKLTPEICMKTKDREKQVSWERPRSDVGRPKSPSSKPRSRNMHTAPSWILSPDSCLPPLRNEGDSGDMYENKGSVLDTMLYHHSLRPSTHHGEQLRGFDPGQVDGRGQIQGPGQIAQTPYAGISPEVFENTEAADASSTILPRNRANSAAATSPMPFGFLRCWDRRPGRLASPQSPGHCARKPRTASRDGSGRGCHCRSWSKRT